MFSMGSKRKASQQTGPPPKQLRESQYDIESTLAPDEEEPKQPQNQRVTRSAPAKAQPKVKKIPIKQKKAAGTRQSARKTGSHQEKVTSNDNDASNASSEAEAHQESRLKQADLSGAKARASHASKEMFSLAQTPSINTAKVAENGFAEANANILNNSSRSLMARPTRVEHQPRAQSANMDGTPLPPPLEADHNEDRELQASAELSLQEPRPSLQMEAEYQAQRIPEAERTAFCNDGLQWNDILGVRKVLLDEKITIGAKNGVLPYYVSQCPLSQGGKDVMKFLRPQPESTQMEKGLVNNKLKPYTVPPTIEPELIRADLYHLIIPRLVRHIHLVYALPGIRRDNKESLRSAADLLNTLSELCYTAVRIENLDGFQLLGLETRVDEALERIKVLADDIGRTLEQKASELESSERALAQKQEAIRRRVREERYTALLQAKHVANKQRSDTYWNQELPDSDTILSEIPSTDEIDNRLWRRKVSGRFANHTSFIWTPALTDVLTDELIKHQDHTVEYRYEQCLKCEPLSSLSVGEIRRRALEIKPFLEEEWLKMTNAVPRYVWTIK